MTGKVVTTKQTRYPIVTDSLAENLSSFYTLYRVWVTYILSVSLECDSNTAQEQERQ